MLPDRRVGNGEIAVAHPTSIEPEVAAWTLRCNT
jgi:hypothetical protein